MIWSPVHWLSGTVRVRVESGFPERVINVCSAQNIAFWDMAWLSPTEFSITLTRGSYLRLRRAAVRLDCTLTVERKEGAPYFARRFRRRYVLLAGLFAALSLVLFGSFFVWDFQIEGNETVSDERILRALEREGVTYGTFGLGIHPEQLKNHILMDIPELSWLTVNVNGFRATVIVRERIQPPPMRDEHTHANIVAKKDGLVTSVQLFNGHAEVLKDSTVTEGQLLISGIADIDERGVYFTRGEGRVFARTWYDLTQRVGKTVREKAYTGRKRTAYTLIVGKQRIKILQSSRISYATYDKITKKEKIRLPGGVVLPVALESTVYREYEPIERVLTDAQAQEYAEPFLSQRLSTLMDEEGEVLKNSFSVRAEGGCYLVTLHAECHEQIGETVEFEQ